MDNRPKNLEDDAPGLEFIVMPDSGDESPGSGDLDQKKQIASSKKWLWFVLGVVGVLILAGGGYVVYRKFFSKSQEPPELTLPEITLPLPTSTETSADEDNDGLTAAAEKEAATDPKVADTDGDGLADGDELNVYKTEPLLADSDQDTYPDGEEILGGFSPTGQGKAMSEELNAWSEAIKRYGLHEPTKTILKLDSSAGSLNGEETTAYANNRFGYSLTLPAGFKARESADGSKVGIFTGTDGGGEEALEDDPIFIQTAVKASEQTLREWVQSQYQAADYGELKEEEISGVKAIYLAAVKAEVCDQDKVFYPKDGTIIIVTLNCRGNADFQKVFSDISRTFKYER